MFPGRRIIRLQFLRAEAYTTDGYAETIAWTAVVTSQVLAHTVASNMSMVGSTMPLNRTVTMTARPALTHIHTTAVAATVKMRPAFPTHATMATAYIHDQALPHSQVGQFA